MSYHDLHVMKTSKAREHSFKVKICSRLLFGKTEGNFTNYKMTTCSLSFLIHVLYDGDIIISAAYDVDGFSIKTMHLLLFLNLGKISGETCLCD